MKLFVQDKLQIQVERQVILTQQGETLAADTFFAKLKAIHESVLKSTKNQQAIADQQATSTEEQLAKQNQV